MCILISVTHLKYYNYLITLSLVAISLEKGSLYFVLYFYGNGKYVVELYVCFRDSSSVSQGI